mmetsp:Transcript_121871/g.242756  ORF Transcript_121871/g.242756 Transcript_121871/m.242756 type:complete len:203 (+) Transcript_121871:240-848(+)
MPCRPKCEKKCKSSGSPKSSSDSWARENCKTCVHCEKCLGIDVKDRPKDCRTTCKKYKPLFVCHPDAGKEWEKHSTQLSMCYLQSTLDKPLVWDPYVHKCKEQTPCRTVFMAFTCQWSMHVKIVVTFSEVVKKMVCMMAVVEGPAQPFFSLLQEVQGMVKDVTTKMKDPTVQLDEAMGPVLDQMKEMAPKNKAGKLVKCLSR